MTLKTAAQEAIKEAVVIHVCVCVWGGGDGGGGISILHQVFLEKKQEELD